VTTSQYQIQAAASEALPVVQKIWHGYNKCAYILSPTSGDRRFRLQLDFFADYTAKGYYKLIDNSAMCNTSRPYKNFFIPSPHVEMLFLLMRRIIKNDMSHEKYVEIRRLRDETPEVMLAIRIEFGDALAGLVDKLLAMTPLTFPISINYSRNALRQYSASISSYSYRAAYRWSEGRRVFQRLISPVGISVCFLSPDGAGKSSVINRVRVLVSGAFHGEQVFYWRPGFLPPLGRLKFWREYVATSDNPNPHSHPRVGVVASLLRLYIMRLTSPLVTGSHMDYMAKKNLSILIAII